MSQRTAFGILTALAIVVGSGVMASAAAPVAGDVSGTWEGSFSPIGGVLYVAEGECVLEVNDDGTFTASITPGPGANNVVKGSRWSGTVVRDGDLVTFRSPRGPWTTLVRKGDVLYGVTNDPTSESDILIKLDRARGSASGMAFRTR